ncbi:uncharacterized protein LOC112452885 [Temnothorax curvispinosus]|uniref:Uncharacterized protein LOC112452885 n=1 Tax=Temnothorax curvispinosus TaxID=300111 RepID=A0A6J1PHM1_9HYME|nr:uncharacterized protein LOC112452885 [Temnothorax curvispinosus]
MITNNKKTGRSRATCPYETELTDLIGSKHNIEPLITSGNKGTILRTDRTTPTFTSGVSETENIPTGSNASASQDISIFESGTTNQESMPIATTPTMSNQSNLQNTLSVEEMQSRNKRQMGTTAKVLQMCQESMKELIERIQEEKHDKIEREKEILTEYRQMRQSYEKYLDKVQEQLIIANKMREERNNLLKAYLDKQTK